MGNKYSSANRKFARYSSRRAGNVTSSTVRFHMLRYLRFMSGILQPYGQGMTDMKPSRIALFAFAAIVGTGTLVGSGQAKAGSLDFLNHMNPQYTSCIASTRANIAPQYRDQRNVHDAIIDNCARRFPPFG
jgi:hypothetical protein